jgi:phage terminase large subunit-like protein
LADKIYMNYDRAEAVINFIESLKVPEGMLQGQQFRLRDWQKKMIYEVYGPAWVKNDLRVVRKVIYSVAKKNGKTPLVATIGLTHLCGPEAKKNEQLYSAAYEREQASITYRYMRQMVEMDEDLSSALNVKNSIKEVEYTRGGSVFKALSSEIKGKHGIGPALLVFDELAQFGADREFYDTLNQGMGAHLEPLMWIISTQAKDDNAVLSQEIDYALKVQNGEIEDPTVRLYLFTAPEECDLMDEEAMKAANPALDDFLSREDLVGSASVAKAMPSAEPGFRNLRLNQRVETNSPFLSRSIFELCGALPDDFSGKTVTCGLDLSAKTDLTAFIVMFREDEVFHVHCFFWTPEEGLSDRARRDRTPYDLWVRQGFIETTPGRTVDYEWVAVRMGEILGDCDVDGIFFDRWRIDVLKKELDRIGLDLPLEPYGQGFKDQSPALEAMEAAFLNGKIAHGNNPVLKMCAANAVIVQDPSGNRKLDKAKSTGRIDGMAALSNAFGNAQYQENEGPSVYENRGVLVF